MKLLWIVPYLPNRIRVRPFELLRALAARDHSITLATLVGDDDQADLEVLRNLGIDLIAEQMSRGRTLWNAAWALPTRWPLQARWSESPALSRRIVEHLRASPPDAVHVEHLRGATYALLARNERSRLPAAQAQTIVWDSVDSISLLFEQAATASVSARARWMARLELGRTRRLEGRLAGAFDHTVVTAEADAAELRRLAGRPVPVTVIPNGVDLEAFRAPERAMRAQARIVLTGKMSYHANVTAAVRLVCEIMPLVWEQRPEVEVRLVGKEPPPEVQALAGPRVIVTGGVASMAAALQEATISAAPIVYGVGIQNKVLEAMACATPVVASTQAASALQAVAGQDLLVAASPGDFAGSLLRLLDDEALRTSVGAAGRAYVERRHSWQAAAAQFEALYRPDSSSERFTPESATSSAAETRG